MACVEMVSQVVITIGKRDSESAIIGHRGSKGVSSGHRGSEGVSILDRGAARLNSTLQSKRVQSLLDQNLNLLVADTFILLIHMRAT